jgi:uncharacterized protein
MSHYTYPGVYVKEIPGGVRTITGVSTSVTAFIGFFTEGPVNKAVKIQGMGDFDRIFGGLNTLSEAGYAIHQFFLNGGTDAWVVRVASEVNDPDPAKCINLKKSTITIKNDETNGANVLDVHAKNEGSWGNRLRVEIDHKTKNSGTGFNLSVTRYSSEGNNALPVKSEKFLNLSLDPADSRYAGDVINEESELIDVVVSSGSALGYLPRATGTLSGDLAEFNDWESVSNPTNPYDGLSGKAFTMKIGTAPPEEILLDSWDPGTVKDLKGFVKYLQKAIHSADPLDPAFTGARVEILERGGNYQGSTLVLRFTSGKKADTYDPGEIITFEDTGSNTVCSDLKLLSTSTGIFESVQEYVLENGEDGIPPLAGDIIGQDGTEPYTGMYALDYVDIFNILCIPRAAHKDLAAGMDTIISHALSYCEKKRAFLIIDIPEAVDTVLEMKNWIKSKAHYRHKNAALYFPRLMAGDPLMEYRLRSIPSSGTIAGIYSKMDGTRGVWKAPAGTDVVLRGVSGLALQITDPQNGDLNPLAVNCFRKFPIFGSIVWGARTLDGSDEAGSEWKYIPVRRLALFLEESLFRGTKWVVFESNDEPLWSNIRMNIKAFMMSLFRQGAFQGPTPQEAFYVKCDEETTTQADRNSGVVNIEVGFAPLKPAEFVVLKFRQITALATAHN